MERARAQELRPGGEGRRNRGPELDLVYFGERAYVGDVVVGTGLLPGDEVRHEEFFNNLVLHCIEHHRDQTINAISRRAIGLPVIGGDILEYRDNKVRTVAEAGIFDQAEADKIVRESIEAWGLAGEPTLKKFVSA